MRRRVLFLFLTVALIACVYSEYAVAQFGGAGAFGDVMNYLKNVNTNILPSVDATYDLGSSSKGWNDIHSENFSTSASSTRVSFTQGVGTVHMFSYQNDALGDTAEVTLVPSSSGYLIVSCGAEALAASIAADGSVVLAGASANTSTTNNNDTTLNVYDNGSSAVVENQLGGNRETRIVYWYN